MLAATINEKEGTNFSPDEVGEGVEFISQPGREAKNCIDGKGCTPGAVLSLGGLALDVLPVGMAFKAGAMDVRVARAEAAAARAQAAKEVNSARVSNNFYADGASTYPVGLQTSAGVIAPNPTKTTTVLGTYAADTNSIINKQMMMPKTNDFSSAKQGGFNLLNTDDALFAELGANKFWTDVNVPFLDAAIKRGDVFAIATKPTQQAMFRNGQLSGFGREIKYLESKGYRYNSRTNQMVKVKP
jgi:hypothetical protein